MIFATANSTYQVDPDNKRIRRLYGTGTATDRFGEDREWKTYELISDIVVGKIAIIKWPKNSAGALKRFTYTSAVVGGTTEDAPEQDPAQTKFMDLPEDAFPFTVEFLLSDTGEVVRTITVDGPGAVEVPPLREVYGVPIDVRITKPDGSQVTTTSA